MKGFPGRYSQAMAARKAQPRMEFLGAVDVTSSTGSITAPRTCYAFVYAWGGGAGGGTSGATRGGGGGGAGYKRVRLRKDETISYSVGAAGAAGDNAGGDTTVTLPNGNVLTAFGGASVTGLGVGGGATGFDLNRTGGTGGGTAAAGTAGEYGGAGGAASGGGGGGGAAGFSDTAFAPASGIGGIGTTSGTAGSGTAPGAGGGGASGAGTGGAGAAGRVRIYLVRTLL